MPNRSRLVLAVGLAFIVGLSACAAWLARTSGFAGLPPVAAAALVLLVSAIGAILGALFAARWRRGGEEARAQLLAREHRYVFGTQAHEQFVSGYLAGRWFIDAGYHEAWAIGAYKDTLRTLALEFDNNQFGWALAVREYLLPLLATDDLPAITPKHRRGPAA